MAPYGKIKADAIVYDNNGVDEEKTLLSLGQGAPLADPAFTGTVTVPTPAADDNTTKAASTAYVQTELLDFAPLADAVLTGTPAAPTASAGNSSTHIATTAFVTQEKTHYEVATSGFNLAVNTKYLTDTTAAAFSVTLPASPSTGQFVVLTDQTGQWATNTLTVGRNSNNIAGQAADLVCNVANAHVTLVWSGNATTGWLVK